VPRGRDSPGDRTEIAAQDLLVQGTAAGTPRQGSFRASTRVALRRSVGGPLRGTTQG
jgi:hypothetical protein